MTRHAFAFASTAQFVHSRLENNGRRRIATTREMASTLAPRANMGVDPTRSRDIMDDMVNVVRIARATPSRAASRPVISNSEDSLVPPSLSSKIR